jgi:hypothetical protein
MDPERSSVWTNFRFCAEVQAVAASGSIRTTIGVDGLRSLALIITPSDRPLRGMKVPTIGSDRQDNARPPDRRRCALYSPRILVRMRTSTGEQHHASSNFSCRRAGCGAVARLFRRGGTTGRRGCSRWAGSAGSRAGGAPQLAAPALPKRWEAGTDRFLRPDVTAGDRPVGASFASRTAAYGLNGAAQRRSNPIGCAILNTGAVTTSAALMINSRDRSNSHRG